MIQVRDRLFETNSSSTHAICVSKTMSEPEMYNFPGWVDSYCFGRCESYLVDSESAKLAYAYIVVVDLHDWDELKKRRDTNKDLENFKKMVFEVAKDYYAKPKDEIERHYAFTEDKLHEFFRDIDKMMENYDAYVDHVEDFVDNGFYEKLVTDKEFIRRLVFNPDSYITVGGDEYRGYNIKTIGFEHDYEDGYNPDFERKYDENNWPVYVDPSEMYIGEFWDKVKKYREDFDVFFKGN